MIRNPLILILSLVTTFTFAGNLQFNIGFATYNSIEQGPFVEFYLSLGGQGLKYVQLENGKYQAAVDITIILNKDSSIYKFEKIRLNSAEYDHPDSVKMGMLDQRRIAAENGTFEVEITLKDANDSENSTELRFPVTIDYNQNKIQISDVEFLSSYRQTTEENVFTKNGYEFIPYPVNFFPATENRFAFYAEIYNTTKEQLNTDVFLVNYEIRQRGSMAVFNDMKRFSKKKAASITPIISEFDITTLPSGNYDLVIEVRNTQNEVISTKKMFFQRSNPKIDPVKVDIASIDISSSYVNAFTPEELIFYIESLTPIAAQDERTMIKNLVGLRKEERMKKFFVNFWLKRSPTDAEFNWEAYRRQVMKVDEAYATPIDHGFETDQGRVYLQYGQPNDIIRSQSEPSAKPYEIWQYYTLGSQSNVKFVFYLPELGYNFYELLHSTANGEIYDMKWKQKIHSNFNSRQGAFDIDNTSFQDHHGSNLDRNFDK